MGQYYTVANMDKKEVLCVKGKFIGGKLLEIAKTATECFAILNQIAGSWKGDGKCMIAIDCGCGFPHRDGQLGCIRLEDMTEYYSDDGIMTKEEVEEWMKRKDEFK